MIAYRAMFDMPREPVQFTASNWRVSSAAATFRGAVGR